MLFPLVCGCAELPVDIIHYEPIVSSADQKIVSRGNNNVIEQTSAGHAVSAMLAGSENVFVLVLKIENKTSADIKAADYSIALTDGRDEKPLALLPREAVIDYRSKLAGGQEIKSGNAMMDLALAQLGRMTKSMSSSHLKEFLQSVDWAVDHYFAFRPIYAHDSREGVLCYYAAFIPEYPLTLKLKLNDKLTAFKFQRKEK
ncbi:MAG: hypothetical protein ABIA67_01125 [Candidatus Margulisiibacteriota bacterium]